MGLWEISTDSGSTFTDFDDLYFFVASSTGTGMVPVQNQSTPLAQQPGSQYQNTATLTRPFTLRGNFNTDSSATKANFHSRKATLLKALNANAGTKINTRPTPLVLRYTGATADKDINCYYEGGFEDTSPETDAFSQTNITLRFVAYDPFFYGTSESNTTLDNQDSATFTVVAGKVDGVWDNLGPPNASGSYTTVNSIVSDDTYVYFAGLFSNFDNDANADRIVRYNKSTGAYSALGSGVNNGSVLDMDIDANGNLFVVGTFLAMDGDTTIDYIGMWDGSAWSSLSDPDSGTANMTEINAVACGPDGNVYVGGNFQNIDSVADGDHVAYWDGSSWNAMGSGSGAGTQDIVIESASKIIYLGSFAQLGGVSDTNGVAYWDGSSWNSMGSSDATLTGQINAGAIDSGGNLYAGGTITSIGGTSVTRLAKYNGTSWSDVGGGTGNTIRSLQFDPDGNLYVSGNFTVVGSDNYSTGDGVALWNGSTWNRLDINLSGTPDVDALWIEDGGDIYIGFDTDGSGTYAGSATVSYSGTAIAYPYVTINRSGGTSDTVIRLSNFTTGAEIYLDYDLLDGETLTLDFRPFSDTPLTATSDFRGTVVDAIRGGSDIGNFYLTPGRDSGSNDNVITLYVEQAGGPTTTCTLYYDVTYLSQD